MKYPGGIKTQIVPANNKVINYGNRGMNLEKELNDTNLFYREENIAFIYKKPTPIKIAKVTYSGKNSQVIDKAYFESPSTTDYNGLYKGKYIDFEAKETTSKTSFPLANIHSHQIEHIRKIVEHGGICFLIVRFVNKNKTFLLLGEDFLSFLKNTTSKSISISYFEKEAYLIKEKYIPKVDYLEIIEQIYGGVL